MLCYLRKSRFNVIYSTDYCGDENGLTKSRRHDRITTAQFKRRHRTTSDSSGPQLTWNNGVLLFTAYHIKVKRMKADHKEHSEHEQNRKWSVSRKTSSATAEIARDVNDVDLSVDDVHSALILARPSQTDGTDKPWNGHSRSLKVIRCCANRRGICDFLLALNSNLTSVFNRSWDITPRLHIHTPPLSRWNWKKDGWE